MEVEPASKGEEEQEEEVSGPATVKEEGMHLENGETPEENEESAGTDSGQELGMEGRNLRSGTYGDRTESKAYGSIIHKCEVRGRGRCQPCASRVSAAPHALLPAAPAGLREGVHAHGELQTPHPHPHG